MQFLMLTALRYGTASALKWLYVNWKEKVIDIPKKLQKQKSILNCLLPRSLLKF